MTNAETLYTARDAARFLQLHPQTVRGLARRGRLKHRRLGRAFLFTQADLDMYLQPQTEIPPAILSPAEAPRVPPAPAVTPLRCRVLDRHARLAAGLKAGLSRVLCFVSLREWKEGQA